MGEKPSVKIRLPREISEITLRIGLREKPNLVEVLSNKQLAALGDSYLNFLYSVYLSGKLGHPTGSRIKGSILQNALKDSGLRKILPKRVDRHSQADAFEALAAYSLIKELVSFKKALKILNKHEDSVAGMTELALHMKKEFENDKSKSTS
ncbi:MAG: hypothetical protein JSW01_01015 [Candidatus Bathyarchaeota archaeon]|nr:MAG: hypothetical protein JSW01_01015 [Candidatus Bathyarchaeota archaeon]